MKLTSLLSILLIVVLVISCKSDDDTTGGTALVDFSITNLVELENATSALTINIGMDNALHAGGTISVEISGGSYGEDYETNMDSGSFTLEVAPNSLISSFSIKPVDNSFVEAPTVLTITLTNAGGSLQLGENTSFTFTILDDDDPTLTYVSVENTSYEVQEDDTAGIPITLIFESPTSQASSVSVSLAGNAVYGTDYTIEGQNSANFTLEVAAGSPSTTLLFKPIDNSDFSANKSVTLSLTDATGGLALGVTTESNITIINDDVSTIPLLDFAAATSSFSEGSGTANVALTLSLPLETEGVVQFTIGGDATIGDDFSFGGDTSNPYTLTIPQGATSGTLQIDLVDDTVLEFPESIELAITNVSGGMIAGITQQVHTLTIENDDQGTQINYLENFESFNGSQTYLNDVLGFENILVGQTVDPTAIISLVNVPGGFSDENTITASSDNGLNMFYNNYGDPSNNGLVDNVLISPELEGTGPLNVQLDLSYNFLSQNSAQVTFYYSQTYDGSGVFNAEDWTVIDVETTNAMFSEGFGNNDYKRESYSIFTTDFFYVAVRVTQEITDVKYRTRWRFDNLRVISE